MKTFNNSNSSSSLLKGTTNLYSTSRNSLIKDFLANTHRKPENTDIPPAAYNRYGFVVCLHGGFSCSEIKRLERVLPTDTDLSLSQNKGFSLSAWVVINANSNGVHRLILKKGGEMDEITPSIGLLPNGENFFVKILTSKHKIESLFSSKTIEQNRLYNLITTFSIDHNNSLTEMSMYIDGLLDSEVI